MNITNDTIRRLQAGDREALKMVYEQCGNNVFYTAYGILGAKPDAEDAMQDIFIKVWKNVSGFNFRASFTSWLYRMTVNHCLGLLRRRKIIGWLTLKGVDPAGERDFEKAEAKAEITVALGKLDPRARSLIVLRELQGLSYEEIAAVTSLPVGTIRSGISRARDKLKAALSP